ncbi:MAG: hypothetical protein C0596_07530 [Marinilabiliales bacterium]|nr:MAG: hypothetical protein C0596_07530 [Marinilabiliales bacterium]
MKYIIILLLSVFTFVFVACDPEEEDPHIENPQETIALAGCDFETWTEFVQGEVTYDIPAGDWWDGLNYLSVIGGPITFEKTTDSYNGEYALRLETKTWGEDLTIPGILASGYFDPEQPIGENLIIGKPFTDKPLSLNGFLKYAPAENDTLVIFVALTKFDSNENIRDTIATGEYTYSGLIETYSPFTVPIEYTESINPDSVHVILLASVSGKEMRGHTGSVLIVDELSFTYE